jgi:hypothetical protein
MPETKCVTFVQTGVAVKVNNFGVPLKYGGHLRTDYNAWSIGADEFEKLRAENPDVEFIDVTEQSKK